MAEFAATTDPVYEAEPDYAEEDIESAVEAPDPGVTRLKYDPKRITPPKSVFTPISPMELVQCAGTLNPLRRNKVKEDGFEGVAQSSSAAEAKSTPTPSLKRPIAASGAAFKRPRRAGPGENAIVGDSREVGVKEISSGQEETNGVEGEAAASRTPTDTPSHTPAPTVTDTKVVAGHYNARPNLGRDIRENSTIYGLKVFNNWIKTVLINKYSRENTGPLRVIDMCCGKGGDLNKWQRVNTRAYVGLDLAEVSVHQARERYYSLRGHRFEADFFALDCFGRPFSDVLTSPRIQGLYDVVSCQFAVHYAFSEEAKVRQLLENVSGNLREGGRFIGTTTDAFNLLDRLEARREEMENDPNATAEDRLTFGNAVYKVKFESDDFTPRFGHKYFFYLEDAVEDVPEYVVYWDEFVEIAKEYGLELVYCAPFQDIFAEHKDEFASLLTRMHVVDRDGNTQITPDQWDAVNLYIGFAFMKVNQQISAQQTEQLTEN